MGVFYKSFKAFTIIGDQPRVNLLLVAGKLKFEDAYARQQLKEVQGVKVPFVNLEDLIKSKETSRPRDLLDIEELKKIKKLSS